MNNNSQQIFNLRLQGLTTQKISETMNISRVWVERVLKSIYNSSPLEVQQKLDQIRYNNRLKERISIDKFSNYQLGIIWSIGSYDDIDNRMLLRYQKRYFLEQLDIFENTIFSQTARTGTQYVIKTCLININEFKELGWTERNSKQRDIPVLDDYRDFLRSYFEIHSQFSWQTTYTNRKKNKEKYYRIKLRVYGNKVLIESINNILSELKIIEKKKPQNTCNNTTKYLSLTDLNELLRLFEYLDSEPRYSDYWNQVDYYMRNPRKYL